MPNQIPLTVDGEPAAAIVPTPAEVVDLGEQEAATARALFESLVRLADPREPFDAVTLVREGRR